MTYLVVFLVLAGLITLGVTSGKSHNQLKKRGVKVPGVIIENKERRSANSDMYRLGGNINHPTVTFVTRDGLEITGSPVSGVVTQFEIVPPTRVFVYYDAGQPQRFCIDFE